MKGKVLIAGLMMLVLLSLLSCSNSGGSPGSTNSDKTGIIINSVSIASDATTTPPTPDPNIDVFSTSATGITKEVVTINIDAVSRNDTGLSAPFPASVQECTITYLKAIEDPSSPSIPSLTIFPDCVLLASTADKPNTCTVTLIDVQRKNDYWNATNQGSNLPLEYPTHYTAQYNCQYRSNFEKDGSFRTEYDFWLADFPLPITVPVGSVVVSANPTLVASGATSAISAAVTNNVGDPVPNDTIVTFTSTAGSLATPFAKTATGLATTTFTAPIVTADTNVTVTASVGGKSGSATLKVVPSTTPIIVPSTVSIASTTGGTVSFTISGGLAPYTTTSSNPTIVCNDTNNDNNCTASDTGIWTGSSVKVRVPVGAAVGDVKLTVTDSAGKTATATVSIFAPGNTLSVTPTILTMHCGGAQGTFVVTSGVPPFTVTSTNQLVTITGSPVSAELGTFTATSDVCSLFPAAPSSTSVQIIVADHNTPPSSLTVTVTVTNP